MLYYPCQEGKASPGQTADESQTGIRVSEQGRDRHSRFSARPHRPNPIQEVHKMSINELQSQVNELRELRRMAAELEAEMESI